MAKRKEPARDRRAKLIATLILVAVGVPLVNVYARAMLDGHWRSQQAPAKALIGPSYDKLVRGETTGMHYACPPSGFLDFSSASDEGTAGCEPLAAPDFTLPDRHGNSWRFSDHKGKVVLMNFWSITCKPCVEEMPSILNLAELVKDREDIEIVTVTTDEDWETVASLFPPGDLPMTVLFDPERAVTQGKFGTRLYPETWMIDEHGIIRYRVDGPRDWGSPIVLDVLESLM